MFLLFLNKKSLIVIRFNVHSFSCSSSCSRTTNLNSFLFSFLFFSQNVLATFACGLCFCLCFASVSAFAFVYSFVIIFIFYVCCICYCCNVCYLSLSIYTYLGIHTDITMLLCYVSVFVIDSECPDWVPYGYTHLHYALCVCCLSPSHRTTYSIQYLVWYVYSMHIGLLACDLR